MNSNILEEPEVQGEVVQVTTSLPMKNIMAGWGVPSKDTAPVVLGQLADVMVEKQSIRIVNMWKENLELIFPNEDDMVDCLLFIHKDGHVIAENQIAFVIDSRVPDFLILDKFHSDMVLGFHKSVYHEATALHSKYRRSTGLTDGIVAGNGYMRPHKMWKLAEKYEEYKNGTSKSDQSEGRGEG